MRGAFVFATACGVSMSGCGPNEIGVDPRAVVDVKVRPASGQALFCPGDAFQVEVLAKMKDGSSCSSTDESRVCMGQKGILKKDMVRVQASAGSWSQRHEFTLVPPRDPLETAAGITLRGWLEGEFKGVRAKSMEGEGEIKPVYQCIREKVFQADGPLQPGQAGRDGPALTIAVTTLSTPYYPNAALIRVDDGSGLTYLVSASADQPARVVSRGQAGAKGASGAPGQPGIAGAAGAECAPGAGGGNGGNGMPGGNGGRGGAGGAIRIIYDEHARDRLEGRVQVASEPGSGGAAGDGGAAGPGGAGGAAGPVTAACQASPPAAGPPGKPGMAGPPGVAGVAGAPGPAPRFESMERARLFLNELTVVTRIEAMPGKK